MALSKVDRQTMKISSVLSFAFLFLSNLHGAAAVEYNCASPATLGAFTITDDCTLAAKIVLTGDLEIVGVPKADGSYPVITAATGEGHIEAPDSESAADVYTIKLSKLTLTGGDNSQGGSIKIRTSYNSWVLDFSALPLHPDSTTIPALVAFKAYGRKLSCNPVAPVKTLHVDSAAIRAFVVQKVQIGKVKYPRIV